MDHQSAEPAAHTYLPLEDMCPVVDISAELSGGDIIEIPCLALSGVVLFPYETMPLRIQNLVYIQFFLSRIRNQRKNDNLLGVLCIPSSGNTNGQSVSVGCCSVIKSMSPRGEFILTVKGRHRFRILTSRVERGVTTCTVKILPDVLPDVSQNSSYRDKFRAGQNHIPQWMYKRLYCPYNLCIIALRIFRSTRALDGQIQSHDFLSIFCEGFNISNTELSLTDYARMDPVRIAYALAANMPLPDAERQELLSAQNIVILYRKIISLLKRESCMLACSQCGIDLGEKKQIFSVPGADGHIGAYVNPHGQVHQTVTLRTLLRSDVVRMDRAPATAQDSWFPGYSWRIVYCRRCGTHLGWRFTRSDALFLSQLQTLEKNTVTISSFWGLRRPALKDGKRRPTGN